MYLAGSLSQQLSFFENPKLILQSPRQGIGKFLKESPFTNECGSSIWDKSFKISIWDESPVIWISSQMTSPFHFWASHRVIELLIYAHLRTFVCRKSFLDTPPTSVNVEPLRYRTSPEKLMMGDNRTNSTRLESRRFVKNIEKNDTWKRYIWKIGKIKDRRFQNQQWFLWWLGNHTYCKSQKPIML